MRLVAGGFIRHSERDKAQHAIYAGIPQTSGHSSNVSKMPAENAAGILRQLLWIL
jgi:hypothetical protein